MSNDLFENLSGLMRGLTGFMPQDTPEAKLMNTQTEWNDLQAKETALYAKIGKQLMEEESGREPNFLGIVERSFETIPHLWNSRVCNSLGIGQAPLICCLLIMRLRLNL